MGIPFDLNQFFHSVENILPQISNKVAVFDADGTLWKEDIGFGFFNYQMNHSLVNTSLNKKSIQEFYKKNQRKACSLLLQINQGTSHSQYLDWVRDYLKTQPLNVFSFQRKIITFLKNKGVQIYVVSASPEWIVKETIQHYELEVDCVIGVKTLLDKDIITDRLYYPLPVAEGKVSAFMEKSKNTYPFFVSGNTLSDLDLLELSTHLKLAVASAPIGQKHYDSERVLLSIAHQKSWIFHDLLDSSSK